MKFKVRMKRKKGKKRKIKFKEKIKEHNKLAREAIKQANLIFVVVDARFINDSRDLEIEEEAKREGKKVILVVNKIDLVPKLFREEIKRYLKRNDENFVIVSSKTRYWFRKLRKLIDKHKNEFKEEGKGRLKIAVIGYTNVGKSSLINTLKGKHSCRTSSLPKFTKGVQWIRLSKDVLLLDSPGTIKFKGISGYLLGIDASKPSWREGKALYEILKSKEEDWDKKSYGIESEDFEDFLNKLAEKYNFKLAKGELDLDRALKKFVNDWNKGKIKVYWI